jgi:hypothetical protein
MISNRYVYTKKPWTVLVAMVTLANAPAIRLRAKAYVLDVQFEKSYETDVTERVIAAFAEHRILPPAILHRSLGGSIDPNAPSAPPGRRTITPAPAPASQPRN